MSAAVFVAIVVLVVLVTMYALVARCLHGSRPAERPEILRALAEVLNALPLGRPLRRRRRRG